MANIYDMSDTWNDGATTFTAIKMNVTDTASASASLLMDLQVGGASKFSVDKDGLLYLFGGASPTISTSSGFSVIGSPGNGQLFGPSGGTLNNSYVRIDGATLRFRQAMSFGWTGGDLGGPLDVSLFRDAANTLAQRNGTNAQTFNIYNTYTDASNYERGFMRWNSNVLEIGAEAAGTGTVRPTVIKSGNLRTASAVFQNSYVSFFETQAAAEAFTVAERSILITAGQGRIGFRAAGQVTWNSASESADVGTAVDTGIGRHAAGIAKITDGSTGTGQLIFIVPTADPGITGALWNNAGTLSISA